MNMNLVLLGALGVGGYLLYRNYEAAAATAIAAAQVPVSTGSTVSGNTVLNSAPSAPKITVSIANNMLNIAQAQFPQYFGPSNTKGELPQGLWTQAYYLAIGFQAPAVKDVFAPGDAVGANITVGEYANIVNATLGSNVAPSVFGMNGLGLLGVAKTPWAKGAGFYELINAVGR